MGAGNVSCLFEYRLPLIAFVMPHMASLLQPVLREDAGPQKELLHESSFYCTMMATRLLALFFTLAGLFDIGKIAILLRQVHSRLLTLRCAFTLNRRTRRFRERNKISHTGLAKLD